MPKKTKLSLWLQKNNEYTSWERERSRNGEKVGLQPFSLSFVLSRDRAGQKIWCRFFTCAREDSDAIEILCSRLYFLWFPTSREGKSYGLSLLKRTARDEKMVWGSGETYFEKWIRKEGIHAYVRCMLIRIHYPKSRFICFASKRLAYEYGLSLCSLSKRLYV